MQLAKAIHFSFRALVSKSLEIRGGFAGSGSRPFDEKARCEGLDANKQLVASAPFSLTHVAFVLTPAPAYWQTEEGVKTK